ncbi:cobalt-precorrin 5A acetaldehyde-lyase [Natranaerovirga pectinivora]|uniref:Cobalt-precorrin 5A acetaldehyde-lyase n=1 Tax=Natranaerovirga pectinivora TaxID=682400 RepID=A0A4R3MLP8_9FIRM|nr:cobalt-precorrin 5A hydrolase [Natranaerovirga pectinivora]TCT13791.1 cobalt-precorrin 5A acetaldehyde-lyase [Natranaerovirga pectinivora]
MKKMAILTLTEGGLKLGLKLKNQYPDAQLYTMEKYVTQGAQAIKPSLNLMVEKLFQTFDVLCFIMATGIVVRVIAPYIKDKRVDPAVLVMDEKGQYIISLLSGHLGNGNYWAEKIGKDINGTPVITTSSDTNGIVAIDTFASHNHCAIKDMKKAKDLTVLLLEGKTIGVINKEKHNILLKKPYIFIDNEERTDEYPEIEGYVYISKQGPKEMNKPFVWLIPKDIVVGIGCKKGKTKEEIEKVLKASFEKIKLPYESIKKLATVSIKEEELGLQQLARALKVPLEIHSIEDIKKVEDQFQGSEFVKKTIGVKSVSEPCGYLGSCFGKCILPVQKIAGITISLWKEDEV